MATAADWSCPICREPSANIAYVGACHHKFCRSCIMRWVRKNPSCPLCRQAVHSILYPELPGQGLVEIAVPQPSGSRSIGVPEEAVAAEAQPQAHVARFSPETWALFFRNHSEVLRPVEVWLNEVLCGACWWDVAFAQGRIVATLCRYGLHEEALVRELQPFLQEQTATFVRQLIDVAEHQCSGLAQRSTQRFSRAAEGLQNSPAAGRSDDASPSTSAALEPREERGRARAEASGAARCGGRAPGTFWPHSGRRGGGPPGSGAGYKKPYRRQD